MDHILQAKQFHPKAFAVLKQTMGPGQGQSQNKCGLAARSPFAIVLAERATWPQTAAGVVIWPGPRPQLPECRAEAASASLDRALWKLNLPGFLFLLSWEGRKNVVCSSCFQQVSGLSSGYWELLHLVHLSIFYLFI